MENYYYDTRRHRLFVRSLYSYVYLMPLMMMLTYYYCYVRRVCCVCISILRATKWAHIRYTTATSMRLRWTTTFNYHKNEIHTPANYVDASSHRTPFTSVVTSTWWKLFGEKVSLKFRRASKDVRLTATIPEYKMGESPHISQPDGVSDAC